jgi:hypothetical protein
MWFLKRRCVCWSPTRVQITLAMPGASLSASATRGESPGSRSPRKKRKGPSLVFRHGPAVEHGRYLLVQPALKDRLLRLGQDDDAFPFAHFDVRARLEPRALEEAWVSLATSRGGQSRQPRQNSRQRQ